jgi:hypothetical protein
MKFREFLMFLDMRLNKSNEWCLGPSISIKIGADPKIYSSSDFNNIDHRYVLFPLKIYGERIRHLNLLILDCKTKIIERFEPFYDFKQINDLLEPFLYKLMKHGKIYFLKFRDTLTEKIDSDGKCGYHCIDYAYKKIVRKIF